MFNCRHLASRLDEEVPRRSRGGAPFRLAPVATVPERADRALGVAKESGRDRAPGATAAGAAPGLSPCRAPAAAAS